MGNFIALALLVWTELTVRNTRNFKKGSKSAKKNENSKFGKKTLEKKNNEINQQTIF